MVFGKFFGGNKQPEQPEEYKELLGENWTTTHLREADRVGLEACIRSFDVKVTTDNERKYLLRHVHVLLSGWHVELYVRGLKSYEERDESDKRVEAALVDIVKGEVKGKPISVPYQDSDYLSIVIRPKGQPDLGRVAGYIDTYLTYVDSVSNKIFTEVKIQPVVMKNVQRDVYNEALKAKIPLKILGT